jgi:hypothetical protein
VQQGFRWLALQAEELPSTPVQAIRDRCASKGTAADGEPVIKCGVWEAAVDYGSPARVAAGFDFYIGQVEGPGQYDRLLQSLPAYRTAFPTLPTAVVTNFGGLDTATLAAPLIRAGLTCIPESHLCESTGGGTPASIVDYAQRVLGFGSAQPMAGLGGGCTLANYPDLQTFPGYSIFAAEELFT